MKTLAFVAASVALLSFSTPALSKSFVCKVVGPKGGNYTVTKGKIGPYRAKVKGSKISFSAQGYPGVINRRGGITANGTNFGVMKCDMARGFKVVKGG